MTVVYRDHEDDDGRVVNPTDNPTFASVLTRREMLKGAATALVLVAPISLRRLPEAAAQSTAGFVSVAASNGDKVIVRAEMAGTQRESFMGFPAKNRKMTIQVVDIHEFKDGKIVRTWHTEDWMTGLRQLGVFEK